jgi:carboxymethylenebutenolidase
MSDATISTQDLTVETPHGSMRVYEAKPSGPPRGAIVVVQEAFGVNPHIEDVTRRAATAGYLAVAPDFFHRSGPGSVCDYGKFEKVMDFFQALGDDDAILNDVDGALGHLRDSGFNDQQIGVVGFCFGGRVSFLVALRRALGASVGFYGGGIVNARFPQFPALVGDAASLQTPWLGLFGDDDASIPVDDVEQLRSAIGAAKVDADVVRYAGAGHGFHCNMREDFRPEAAADAWQRTLDWFGSHLS